MDATVTAADGWEPILAAALLGAERAPPAPPGPLADLITEPDPGAALLARLAAGGLHHLAGLDLAPDAMAPLAPREPAGRDCPPAAAMRLYGLLGGGHAARERLGEWFDLAAAARMRPPAWLHQALMLQARSLPETARPSSAPSSPGSPAPAARRPRMNRTRRRTTGPRAASRSAAPPSRPSGPATRTARAPPWSRSSARRRPRCARPWSGRWPPACRRPTSPSSKRASTTGPAACARRRSACCRISPARSTPRAWPCGQRPRS